MAMGPLTLDNSASFSRQTTAPSILGLPKVEPAATVESVLKGMEAVSAMKRSLFDQPRQEARQEFIANRDFQRAKTDEPAIYQRGLRVGEAKDNAYLALVGPTTDYQRKKLEAEATLLPLKTGALKSRLEWESDPEYQRFKMYQSMLGSGIFGGRSSTSTPSYPASAAVTEVGPDEFQDAEIIE